MSIQAISWVLEFSQSLQGARLVLLSIANHASDRGNNAWPSIATIAHEAGLSERQVQYCLPKLEALGELEVRRGVGRGNTHLFAMPKFREWIDKLHPPKKGAISAEKGAIVAPEPSLKQPSNPSTSSEGLSLDVGLASEEEPISQINLGSSSRAQKNSASQPGNGAPAFVGQFLIVSLHHDQRLAFAFPWIADRQFEYRKADLWLESHPNRRPRKVLAFLKNWFSREPKPPKPNGGIHAPDFSDLYQ